MAIHGKISIRTVLLFVSPYEYFSADIMVFTRIAPLLRSDKPILDKLMAIVEETNDIFTGKESPSFEDEICINDFSFQYMQDVTILKGLNLTIRKGEKIALIGQVDVENLPL